MNDAQQEMSPDFVLMHVVSAAEYDRLDHQMSGCGGFGPVKAAVGLFERDPSSPLPVRGQLAGGLVKTQASPSSSPEDFAVAAQRFVDSPVCPGSVGQRMLFKNMLGFGDRISEPPGERQQLHSGSGTAAGSITAGPGPGGGKDRNIYCVPAAEENLQLQLLQWHPVPELSKGSRTPQLADLALESESGTGLLEPSRNYFPGEEDPVLTVARRLGQLGEGTEEGGTVLPLSQCFLSERSGVIGPQEEPSKTSDTLLVVEGLGSEQVVHLGGGGDSGKGDREGGVPGGAGPVFSSGTLSGLMQQVHKLAEEAGLRTNPHCQSSPANLGDTVPTRNVDPHPSFRYRASSQPQSRASTTPKLGRALRVTCWPSSPLVVLEGWVVGGKQMPQRKLKTGGSLKVRLSKLFRTRSPGGRGAGLLDRRPSLTSSDPSGGSLLDVWGSICSNKDFDGNRLQISKPHRDFTPAFTDDFGGLSTAASMQSLPPRPVALPPSLSSIQHSLSLNDTFMSALPKLVPQPPSTPPIPKLGPRCPLGPADSFASSLRELEKVFPRPRSSSCIRSRGSTALKLFSIFVASASDSWSGSTTSRSCRCQCL